jgi:Fe-S-cluster-containing dehydrogenase component
MGMFGGAYNTIAFDAAKCDGCGDCMTACATAKFGSTDTRRSRIQIVRSGSAASAARPVSSSRCAASAPTPSASRSARRRR